ncbi:MAG: LytTR family DNA-binding domain-containing protein [Hyphomonadaceae bacterium]
MQSWLKSLPRMLVMAAGLGLIFAWLKVYGALPDHFGLRWGYWSSTMAAGILTSSIAAPLIFDRYMARQPYWLQVATLAAVISLPVTGLILALDGEHIAPLFALTQYGYVFVISVILTSAAYVYDQMKDARSATAGDETGQSGDGSSRFMERLPMRLRSADLYAIQSEDHYLRVHTSGGDELILMRLSDAIRELSGVEGLQTHRSWWVARAGVAEVVRAAGKVSLKLKSNVEAPVSRSYASDVKAAGWG